MTVGKGNMWDPPKGNPWGPMKEVVTLQPLVLDLCTALHLLCYNPNDPLMDVAGWLDLAIIGPGGFMLRELKMDGKYPRPEQRVWINVARAAGIDVDVWRGKDWESGRIRTELEALATGGTAEARVIARRGAQELTDLAAKRRWKAEQAAAKKKLEALAGGKPAPAPWRGYGTRRRRAG